MGKNLRVGIVGMGNAGMMHAKSLMDEMVPRASLSAACDAKERLKTLQSRLPPSVRLFDGYKAMLSSGACDAVVVATPHLMHPEQSEMALLAGLHVLCEKPLGVSVGPVKRLLKTAAKMKKVFAVNFIRRQEPVYRTLAKLIRSGELGSIYRIGWTATDFYRSDSYFQSAPWRGTWAGEGGGTLINQAIHNIDIWQHLFGLPSRIRAFCGFGKRHDIEVEDEVVAYMEYASGAIGTLVASTCESPGVNRLEIAGSRGRIHVEGRSIVFNRTLLPIEDFNKRCESGFGEPESWTCSVPVAGEAVSFSGMQRNFVDAVLDGAPLLVHGEEGLASLEIVDAILLSSWTDSWVSLPVDEKAFERELSARSKASRKPRKKDGHKVLDLNDSFK